MSNQIFIKKIKNKGDYFNTYIYKHIYININIYIKKQVPQVSQKLLKSYYPKPRKLQLLLHVLRIKVQILQKVKSTF